MSLMAGTTYIVNIGGGTGTPVQLKAGANPFVTQEDDDDDMFTPIRTQSGYLRIVDDGYAADGVTAFDWKDLIPATDISRPVTLTAIPAGQSTGTVKWQGFMQAQDFGSTLYGNPQEREFPIQCVLTVTQGTDINYQQTGIQNFAYLLKQIVDAIPSAQRPTDFYIQGGSDAQQWLLKKIDWQNYVSEDADGNLTARFNCYDCLQDMCAFWGWTARTKGTAMYLTCADDSAETNWLHLTYANLTTMASGTTAGTTSDTFTTTNLDYIGDIFASTGNDEYVQRGPMKATVSGDGNTADANIIDYPPSFVLDAMLYPAKYGITPNTEYEYYGDVGTIRWQSTFLTNLTAFPSGNVKSAFMEGSAVSGKASFATVTTAKVGTTTTQFGIEDTPAIRINKTYESGVVLASLATTFEHSFKGGILRLHGNVFVKGQKFTDPNDVGVGKKHMYIRLGIGATRNSAVWYDGDNTWGSTPVSFKVNVGSNESLFYRSDNGKENININGVGRIFIDFMGSDDTDLVDGSYSGGGTEERRFFITDFALEYVHLRENADPRRKPLEMKNDASASYVSSNNNKSSVEWNRDMIYVTMNLMKPGYGIIMNTDYTLAESANFNGTSARPEQHLANRVTDYWQTSKRRIATELRANVVPDITPRHKVVLDGMTAYPIAISHDWWNDTMTLIILEL